MSESAEDAAHDKILLHPSIPWISSPVYLHAPLHGKTQTQSLLLGVGNLDQCFLLHECRIKTAQSSQRAEVAV